LRLGLRRRRPNVSFPRRTTRPYDGQLPNSTVTPFTSGRTIKRQRSKMENYTWTIMKRVFDYCIRFEPLFRSRSSVVWPSYQPSSLPARENLVPATEPRYERCRPDEFPGEKPIAFGQGHSPWECPKVKDMRPVLPSQPRGPATPNPRAM